MSNHSPQEVIAARVRHLHHQAGLVVLDAGSEPNFTPYTPDEFRIRSYSGFHDPWVLHDLAHYIVAHPESREMENFGLGADVNELMWPEEGAPLTHKDKLSNAVSEEEWAHQETRALAMHFFLVKEVFGRDVAESTVEDGNFRFHEKEPAAAVVWVHDQGLVHLGSCEWSGVVYMGEGPNTTGKLATQARKRMRSSTTS